MRLSIIPVLSLISLAPAASAQFGPLRLVARTEVHGPRYATVDDLDGDGDNDVVVVAQDGSLRLYRNDGTGDMGRAEDAGSIHWPDALRFIDFDEDGDVDVLGGSRFYEHPDTVYWASNDGTGHFAPAEVVAYGSYYIYDVDAADIDGDGDLDILTASEGDHLFAWYANDGTMVCGPPQDIDTDHISPRRIATGDLDGDGDMDAVLGTGYDNDLTWYANEGGSFSAGQELYTFSNAVVDILVDDVDGDGDADVLASAGSPGIREFINNGTGDLSASVELPVSASTAFGLEDINGDGHRDLWGLGSALEWSPGDGNGNFTGVTDGMSGTGVTMTFACIGDLDGDGGNDLVSTWSELDEVWYIPNTGNGIFPAVPTIFSQAMNTVRVLRSADVDGDGDLDVVASSQVDHRVVWLENTAGPTWPEHPLLELYEYWVSDFVCIDAEGDGDIDLLANIRSALNYGDMHWLINDGLGHFALGALVDEFSDGGHLGLKDLDQDGLVDILYYYSSVKYMHALPGGGFEAPVWLGSSLAFYAGDAGDIDGDGDMDIVGQVNNPAGVAFLENDGSMQFADAQFIEEGVSPAEVRFGDADGDGDQDVFTSGSYEHGLTWYENDGGFFLEQHVLGESAMEYYQATFTVEDLDGDGDVDVAVSGNQQYEPSRYFANDGSGDFGAPISLSPGHGDCFALCASDFDGDGDKDIAQSLDANSIWITLGYAGSPCQLSGRLYFDANGNNQYDTGEPGLPGAQLVIDPPAAAPVVNADGSWSVLADATTYSITAIPPGTDYLAVAPDSYQTTLTSGEPVQSGLDLGFTTATPAPQVVANVTTSFLTCTGQAPLWATVTNTGNTLLSGTAKLGIDPLLNYASAVPVPDAVSGDTLLWNFAELGPGASLTYAVFVVMPGAPSAGDAVVHGLHIEAGVSGGGPIPAVVDQVTDTITCSGEANTKVSDPVGEGEFHLIPTETPWLDYTIAFSNTGTAPANTVVVEDPLPPYLDVSGLQVLGASHPFTMSVVESDETTPVVSFHFTGIDLPTSTQNPAGSQGFVTFRIPVINAELHHGYQFYNQATIHLYGDGALEFQVSTWVSVAVCDEIEVPILFGTWGGDYMYTTYEETPWTFISYQWYLNGELLEGQNAYMIYPQVSGSYTVEITDLYGCTVMSAPYNYVITGISGSTKPAFALVPNPATDAVRVVGPGDLVRSLELLDALGRVVARRTVANTQDLLIHRDDLPAGLYTLRLMDRDSRVIASDRFLFQ